MRHGHGRIAQGVAPGAVVGLDAMDQLLFGKSVERAINGDFVSTDGKLGKNLRHAQRAGSLDQQVQHRAAHRGAAQTGVR